ncbi:MAG: LysE family translocator [Alphaproteobacteria bacterium]
MTLNQWLIFVAVWTAASLPLGPNALNLITSAATDGFRQSLWGIVGIVFAAICHMTATTLGAATILLANAAVFQTLKLIGAAYLIWMGVSLWRNRGTAIRIERQDPASPTCLVRRAFLISMTNPKAILSYLAVFSQFLQPNLPLAGQLVVLIPTALVIVVAVYFGYAMTGLGVKRLLGSVRRRTFFNKAVGSVYMLAGIGLATIEPSSAPAHEP